MITIVGLGCQKKQLTLQGAETLANAKHIYIKTCLTETFYYFQENNIEYISLDSFFDGAENFDALNSALVDFLIAENAKFGDICLCVNGSGKDDRTVVELFSRKEKLQIIPSVSMFDCNAQPMLSALSTSAYELLAQGGFDYDTRNALFVRDIDNQFVASELKILLSNLVGEEEKILFNNKEIFVYELDRQKKYDYSCYICILPLAFLNKKRHNIVDLYCILQALRGENGCPWDKAQTHETIRQNAIEEAYELVEAINNNDVENMREESGDIVLQAMFHCVIGQDCGEYNWQDSLSTLCRKLIDRHTHIFGNVVARNASEALVAWDNAKAKEKKYETFTDKMRGIAKALPALMRAQKTQSIAAKAGFEFDNYDQVLDKIKEELAEFVADNSEEEGGDLLIAVAKALKWQGINAEVALDGAIEKFVTRFEYVESHAGKPLTENTSEANYALWKEAKIETRNS
ncbi:MAG: nucleoside triphosphate pyrophosphohydrolase [Clostridia bacterium]